jgi:17beta-estradiol 17-dehydrogenase / very-long-chain 3-oxoacyl-CoA reductase
MDAFADFTDSIGIHIDAKSPAVRAAATLLLLAGVVTVTRPFLSLARVLLSLFVLPGKSVCNIKHLVPSMNAS